MKKSKVAAVLQWNFIVVRTGTEMCVIHKNQLDSSKKSFFWPPYLTTDKCNKAVEEGRKPKTTWKKYEITKVFKKFEMYDEAVKYYDMLTEEGNNVESEVTDLESSKSSLSAAQPPKAPSLMKSKQTSTPIKNTALEPHKTSKRPRLNSVISSSSSDIDDDLSSSSPQITPPSGFIKDTIETDGMRETNDQHQLSSAPISSTDIIEQVVARLLNHQTEYVNQKFTNLEKKFDRLETFLMKGTMFNPSHGTVSNGNELASSILDNPLKLPVKTKDDLEILDQNLANLKFEKEFINKMVNLGGTKVKDVVYNMFDVVYDPIIAHFFNFEGTKSKSKLSSKKSLQVIQAIASKHYKFKDDEIKQTMTMWLKNKGQQVKKAIEKENSNQERSSLINTIVIQQRDLAAQQSNEKVFIVRQEESVVDDENSNQQTQILDNIPMVFTVGNGNEDIMIDNGNEEAAIRNGNEEAAIRNGNED